MNKPTVFIDSDHQKRHSLNIGIILAVISAIVFGLWPPSVRGIYQNGGNFTFILLVTTWARALSLAGFCVLTRKSLFKNCEDIKQAIIGGFFQIVCIISLFKALEFLTGPVVIIILFSHTLMLLFFMAWRGKIKLDWFTFLTTIVALVGLSMVLDIWHQHSANSLLGIGLAFVAALATVSRLYVWGHQTQNRHPIVVGAECFIATALFGLIALFFDTPNVPALFAGDMYAFLGCFSLTLGTFGMFYGIGMMGSFRWSLFLKLEPVFTALFSAVLLNEILKLQQYFGIFVVVVSLVIYQVVVQKKGMKR